MFRRLLLLLIRICLIGAIFFSYSEDSRAWGQDIVKTQDLGLWMSGEVTKKFKKDYTFSFSQELRLFESMTEIDKYISQAGLGYRINKHFSLSGDIRYSFTTKKDKTVSQDFRYNADLQYKWKINKDFTLKYRLRFQTRYPNLLLPTRKGTDSDFRHRFSIDYDANKVHELGFSVEIWREFELYEKPHFGKIRLLVWDNMHWNTQRIKVFGGVESDIDDSTPLTYFLIGINYQFEL